MKLKFSVYLILLVVLVSACTEISPSSGSIPNTQTPPTPYPDTPSPAKLDAPLIQAPALEKLDMFDELNGWGMTESQIARTNDGGVTWHDVTPPNVQEAGASVDMFVLDDDHAWVQKPEFDKFPNSGTLYRTTDGGITWTNSSVPFSRGDLKFLDAKNGWVLADLGVGAGSNAVAIYQTSDGGMSWDQTYINDPNVANATDSLPLGGIKSDLIPLDMKTAWVTGVIYTSGEAYLYRTDDGGHNWKEVSITLPKGAENIEIDIDRDQMKFVSANDGFLALRMAGDLAQTAVYVTQDAGKTWVPPSTPLDGAGASVFLSTQDAVIYNGKQFYVTRDAAHTWIAVTPNISFGDSFAGMDFVNVLSGWALTLGSANHHSLYRTTDGGRTWSAVIP